MWGDNMVQIVKQNNQWEGFYIIGHRSIYLHEFCTILRKSDFIRAKYRMANYTKFCRYLRQNSKNQNSGVLCENPCNWRWVLLPPSTLPSPLPNRQMVQLLQNGNGSAKENPWPLRKSNLFTNPECCHISLRVFRNGQTNSDVEKGV